jgi:DNA repair exonuclease SbcCD ATPase subunit
MILRKIEICNFYRVKSPITVELANQGLVLITGSNGNGKSTIYNAILWCLWGRVVESILADAVINNQVKKNCYVKMWLDDDEEGRSFIVSRYRSHTHHKNNLYIDEILDEEADSLKPLTQGTPSLTQERLDKTLGISYETFIRGPMMPQGSFARFSEMTDAEQKAVLENILQLQVLSKAQEISKQKLSQLELDKTNKLMLLAQKQDYLSRSKTHLDSMQFMLDSWSSSQRKRLLDTYLNLNDIAEQYENKIN